MTDKNQTSPTFVWNAGGWFGSQFGCTLWMLILGFVLLARDFLAAWVCIAGFVVLNVWGLYLWQARARRRAYAAIQWFLLAASGVIAIVVVTVNVRGLSEPATAGALVSTYLPYWVVAVAPGLMLVFFWRQRAQSKKH